VDKNDVVVVSLLTIKVVSRLSLEKIKNVVNKIDMIAINPVPSKINFLFISNYYIFFKRLSTVRAKYYFKFRSYY